MDEPTPADPADADSRLAVLRAPQLPTALVDWMSFGAGGRPTADQGRWGRRVLALLGAAPGPGLDAAHLFPPAWTRLRAECLALALAPVLVADRSLLIAMLRRLRRADCSAAALRRLVRPGLIDDPADRRLMRILAHLDGRLRLDLEQPAGSHRRALTIEPLWPAGLLSLSRIHRARGWRREAAELKRAAGILAPPPFDRATVADVNRAVAEERRPRRPRPGHQPTCGFLVVPYLQSGSAALNRFLAEHPDARVMDRGLLDDLLRRGDDDALAAWGRRASERGGLRPGLVLHGVIPGADGGADLLARLARHVDPARVVFVCRHPLDMMRGIYNHQLVAKATRYDFAWSELPWFREPIGLDAARTTGALPAPDPAHDWFPVRRPWPDFTAFCREHGRAHRFGRDFAALRRAFPDARALALDLSPGGVGRFMRRLFERVGLEPGFESPVFTESVNALSSRFFNRANGIELRLDRTIGAAILPTLQAESAALSDHEVDRVGAVSFVLDHPLGVLGPERQAGSRILARLFRDAVLPTAIANVGAITRRFARHRLDALGPADISAARASTRVELDLLIALAPNLRGAWPDLAA